MVASYREVQFEVRGYMALNRLLYLNKKEKNPMTDLTWGSQQRMSISSSCVE